jgi:hypothetical protein
VQQKLGECRVKWWTERRKGKEPLSFRDNRRIFSSKIFAIQINVYFLFNNSEIRLHLSNYWMLAWDSTYENKCTPSKFVFHSVTVVSRSDSSPTERRLETVRIVLPACWVATLQQRRAFGWNFIFRETFLGPQANTPSCIPIPLTPPWYPTFVTKRRKSWELVTRCITCVIS